MVVSQIHVARDDGAANADIVDAARVSRVERIVHFMVRNKVVVTGERVCLSVLTCRRPQQHLRGFTFYGLKAGLEFFILVM